MASYDVKGLYEFLSQTPEQGLRKMLVDGKTFSDSHFSLLLKIVRTGQTEFCECAEKESFPKVKFGPAEQKLKDTFWPTCVKTLEGRGLLNPAQKAA